MKIIHKSELDEYADGKCGECHQEVDMVIEIDDGFSAWACLECLRRAVKMLEEQGK